MSTVPRVSSALPGQEPSLGSALAHQPELQQAFGRVYGTFWSQGTVDPRTKEVARIRNARVTNCTV